MIRSVTECEVDTILRIRPSVNVGTWDAGQILRSLLITFEISPETAPHQLLILSPNWLAPPTKSSERSSEGSRTPT